MDEPLYAEESYAIRGAIFEVYREMGSGFLESVFQECPERSSIAGKCPGVFQGKPNGHRGANSCPRPTSPTLFALERSSSN